jgi:uncharacterized protein
VRRGLGGKSGDGRQYMSWIHCEDFIRSVSWLIEHEEVSGAVTVASPNPLPNVEFMRALRQARGIRVGLPATKWMLEVGAVFLRTETELILKSRRVVPGRLLDAGFMFGHPTWLEAARSVRPVASPAPRLDPAAQRQDSGDVMLRLEHQPARANGPRSLHIGGEREPGIAPELP